MNQSSKWSLNSLDWSKWLHNSFVFFAPVGIIYLGSVAVELQSGFSFHAFALSPAVQGVAALYVVNTCLDLLRKLLASGTSVPEPLA